MAASVLILVSAQQAAADYVTKENLRQFIVDKTLEGRTALDKEPWRVHFSADGFFKETNAKGIVLRGRWFIKGRGIVFEYDRKRSPECRMLYINSQHEQEWRECNSERLSSLIIAPKYDVASPDYNAWRRAQSLEGIRTIQGVVRGVPIDNSPLGRAILQSIDVLLSEQERLLLSEDGQRRHVAALHESFALNKSTDWSGIDEGGGIKPLRQFVNSKGDKCMEYESQVTVKGDRKVERRTMCDREDGTRYAEQ